MYYVTLLLRGHCVFRAAEGPDLRFRPHTFYQGGLPATRRLDLVSAQPLRKGSLALHYRRAG